MQVDTPQVETPVQPIQPAEPAPAEPVAEPTIKQHIEARQPDKRRRDVDDARPEERETIGALTKRLRDAEEASGIKRQPNESNRVYDLRVRTELAERLRDASKPKEPARRAEPIAMPTAPGEFAEKEPTLDQFKDDDDPATAYYRALTRYELKKEQHDAKVEAAKAATGDIEGKIKAYWNHQATEHASRLDTFVKANPGAQAKLEAIGDKPLSPILFGAIQIHPDSAKMMMALAEHPELHDELFLLTDGKPIGDPTRNPLIGIVQRRLLAKAQTVQSPERSPKPEWKPPAPPPTPVRTQPTAIAAQPEEKSGGIMAHVRKHYSDRD